jgi:hypothetical protein
MDRAIETPHEAKIVLNDFLLARQVAIPSDVREQLISIINLSSPIETAVEAAELIYARREELPTELLELGAQTAAMCASFDFYGFRSKDNRGYAMAKVLRKLPDMPKAPKASELKQPDPAERYAPKSAADGPPASDTAAGGGGDGAEVA